MGSRVQVRWRTRLRRELRNWSLVLFQTPNRDIDSMLDWVAFERSVAVVGQSIDTDGQSQNALQFDVVRTETEEKWRRGSSFLERNVSNHFYLGYAVLFLSCSIQAIMVNRTRWDEMRWDETALRAENQPKIGLMWGRIESNSRLLWHDSVQLLSCWWWIRENATQIQDQE